MPLFSSGAQPTSYLFIDGASLSETLTKIGQRYFGGERPPIQWSRIRQSHRKVFYYDAIPVQLEGEDNNSYWSRTSAKREELSHIEREDGFHVRTGDVRHRRRRGNEQKMVDVQLAVDTLLMASRGLFSSCSLITGDLDFKPLVSALVDMGVDVHLYYPPGETNEELIAAADRGVALTVDHYASWLPDRSPFASRVPSASFDSQDPGFSPTNAVMSWHDPAYGHCFIVPIENSRLRLITATCPTMPNTHRLRIEASDREMIAHYAIEKFGLPVPS